MDLKVLYTNYCNAYQIYKDMQNFLKNVPVDETNSAMQCHAFFHLQDTKNQYAKQFHGPHFTELNRLYEQAHREYVSCKSNEYDSKLKYKNKCERDLYGNLNF